MEKKHSIIILGGRGMLGHVLFDTLKNINYDILSIVRNEIIHDSEIYCDVTDFNELEKKIIMYNPKYIINCVGLLVKNSNENPSNAILINSYLPHFLDNISLKHNFKLIHISTDCVFDGSIGSYTENSYKSETNYYGLTKNLGEINNNRNLTIRTSIIGPEIKSNGTGLLDWYLKSPLKKIEGYTNVFWSGLTTYELSKFIKHIILTNSDLSGIIHACNNSKINKFDLIQLFEKTFNTGKDIIENNTLISDKSIINTRFDLNYKFPTYEKMISELFSYMVKNVEFYRKIYKF